MTLYSLIEIVGEISRVRVERVEREQKTYSDPKRNIVNLSQFETTIVCEFLFHPRSGVTKSTNDSTYLSSGEGKLECSRRRERKAQAHRKHQFQNDDLNHSS